MDVLERIREQVTGNAVVIYMKGTPQFPQCGFSNQAVQALKACEVEFAYVNVLDEPEIRQNMRNFSNWPTFPQLFAAGELVGGADITMEMFQKGELRPLLQEAVEKAKSA